MSKIEMTIVLVVLAFIGKETQLSENVPEGQSLDFGGGSDRKCYDGLMRKILFLDLYH